MTSAISPSWLPYVLILLCVGGVAVLVRWPPLGLAALIAGNLVAPVAVPTGTQTDLNFTVLFLPVLLIVGLVQLVRRGDWIDQPSIGIPYLYVATGLELAEALSQRDQAAARTVLQETRSIAQAMRLDQAVAGVDQLLPQLGAPSDTARARPLPLGPARQQKQP